jgi:DNA-binding CsgD family transcriptional regulator
MPWPVTMVIGRRDELDALERFLASVPAGPAGLFVEGAAGIGKTRLWHEALDSARRRGYRVLSARPGGAEVQLAFAGLADLLGDALDDVLPALPRPQRRALEIALLLEDVRGVPPDQRAVSAAFLGALRALAAERPLVVAVDDLQWLDAASAFVLAFAARRLESEPVGLLATVRLAPEEAEPAELAHALGDERLTRLPLGPMTVAAVYELIRVRLDFPLPRSLLLRVHEASGGNPFLALELARELRHTGREVAPDEPLPVPHGVRDLVLARLARLPESARETLLAAAALSQPTLALLERAMPERAVADVGTAAEAGVVDVDGDRVRFTHPLLASIHYGSASRSRQREVHNRLADVATDPEEQVRHRALAAEGPDEDVAEALADAAARAKSRGALAAGAELAEQALHLTPPDLPTQAHARLLIAAEQHYAAGNTVRAVTLLDDALVQAAPGPTRAELLWSLGKIRFEGQDVRVGLELFRRASEEGHDDDLLRSRILESLTYASAKHGGFPAAQEYAGQAAEFAERLGDVPTLARALARLGYLKFVCGEGLVTELFERAVSLEERLGGLGLDYGPTVMYARALSNAGEFERARPLLERLCNQGRASGDAAVNMPLWLLADLEFQTGNWERAAELARESYDVAVQTGREAAEPRGLFQLAYVDAALGEVDAARTKAEHALVLTEGRGWNSGGPRGALGFLELSLENHEAAYEAFIPAIERYRGLGAPMMPQDFDAAEALAGLGRVDDGWELLGPAEETARRTSDLPSLQAAARARGLLAAAGGDLEAAQTALEEAVHVGERAGNPLSLARSLLALGAVQRRALKKQAARRTLERALEVFEQLGAHLWAERARRELGRIGGRAAPREELSATENEIVELVVAGRSNKEVAHALHLSPKTVEWNLSKVYRKLGVHSRTELAAARSAHE